MANIRLRLDPVGVIVVDQLEAKGCDFSDYDEEVDPTDAICKTHRTTLREHGKPADKNEIAE